MTEKSPPPAPAGDRPHEAANADQAELGLEIVDALARKGLLIPETVDEVELAESAEDTELPLPKRLASFEYHRSNAEARVSNVVPLRERPSPTEPMARRAWPNYLTGFALGAAAASVFWVMSRPTDKPPPAVGGATTELRGGEQPLALPTYTVDVESSCKACCAGSACVKPGQPDTGASTCASGRQCVSCSPSADKNAYKLRISAVGFTPEGRQWATNHGGPSSLQVCAEIQGKSLGCRSAVEEPGDLLEWSSLPVATTSGQLVGGLRVELRAGASPAAPLATWASAVTVTPDTLCRGLSARLTAGDVNVGRVSVFFDDPYFVELGRANTVSQLLALEKRFQVNEGGLAVYETTSPGDRNFALVYGPTDRAVAERVHWQLLDQNLNAPVVLGDDFRGQPRPR